MEELWPAVLLAWIAGFIDALGYLMLSNVFTAHMSGNSAAFGARVGQGDWHQTLIRGSAIPPFIVGVALGVFTHVMGERLGLRARLLPAFVLELLCLVSFLGLSISPLGRGTLAGNPMFFVLLSLLAMAMGLQNATLHRAGKARVQTTAVTGTLINMTENALLWLFLKWDRLSPPPVQAVQDGAKNKAFGPLAVTFGLIFLSFILGTVCGGLGKTAWGPLSLLAPIVGLVLLILLDLRCAKPR